MLKCWRVGYFFVVKIYDVCFLISRASGKGHSFDVHVRRFIFFLMMRTNHVRFCLVCPFYSESKDFMQSYTLADSQNKVGLLSCRLYIKVKQYE